MGESKQEEAKVEAQPEAKPVEEKKEEKTEEKKEEKKEEINVQVPTILWVDLHCVGCAKKVERSIRNFRGVEEVELDMNENQVRVKGIVDPQALCLRIQRKTKRRVRLLSPLPKPEENNSAPEVITSKVSRMTTVELNVNMHCEACSQQLKKKILKMRGVQTVETDLESGKVTVIGTMNAERLVEYVYRRTKKLASIVPQPPKEEEKKEETPAAPPPPPQPSDQEEKKEENGEKKEVGKPENGDNKEKESDKNENSNEKNGDEKKAEEGEKNEAEGNNNNNNNNEDGAKKMVVWPPLYVMEHVPAPQIFSDENPNACCIT